MTEKRRLRLAHWLQGRCMSKSANGLWCEDRRGHKGMHINRMLPGWRSWV